MIRYLSLLTLTLIPALVMAEKSLSDYQAKKISDHTYVIHGPLEQPNPGNKGFMNNPAFIIADKGVVVVDPGSTEAVGKMVLSKIKAVTDKPVTHIFNTHIHGDHWLGNDAIKQAFPTVVVMADPRMISKAKAGEADSWINLMDRLTDGASKGTRIMYPNKAVSDSNQLKIHNFNFRIHSVGKAHSDSDIMIQFVEDELLFTGDNVLYQRIARMDDGHFKDSIAACDRAISLKLKHYVPGHGETGDISIIEKQKNYFVTLYNSVKQYYEKGMTDYEMKPKIVDALSAYKDWPGFSDEVGKHISLALLEVEQEQFE